MFEPLHPPHPPPTVATPGVSWHAAQSIRQLSHHGWEREDLEQHLAAELVAALPHYDPSRGASLRTYADRVLRNARRMLVRQARAAKRTRTAHDPMPSRSTVGPETRLDVRSAQATLPQDLRDVCDALLVHTPTEAAKHLGLSRQQLYRRREHVRRHFEAHGLGGTA